jgi:hypothetical protein
MSIFKKPLIRCLIFALVFPVCAGSARQAAGAPFFFQKWDAGFHLRSTENGDTLSIGAVFASDREIFIYDLAAGEMVVLDSSGKALSRVRLEEFGRGTYAGDDFAVLDSMFVFVNTVDKRLEYYNRFTGKRSPPLPLPLDALKSQTKRAWRLINRIFVIDKNIYIGNEHVIFDCTKGLKKSVSAADLSRAPDNARFAIVGDTTRWVLAGSRLLETRTGKKALLPQTHFDISGKRLFVFNNRLFSVQALCDGASIVELKKNP